MFQTIAATRRRQDQERILLHLHAAGLSFLSLRDISQGAGIPENRTADALRILQSTQLVTRQDRGQHWGLTSDGQRLANARLVRAGRFSQA